MCVIVNVQAGKNLTEDQIWDAACKHSDGFGGVAFLGNGRFERLQTFDAKGTNPDEIMVFMDKYKNVNRIAHFRFATAGTKSFENTHPFNILNDGNNQMFLMHNGTLSHFRIANDPKSDTHLFAEKILTPYISTCRKAGMTTEQIIFDPILQHICKTNAGTTSVFLLFDQHGNTLTINESKGKEFPWGWASNDYTFDKYSWRDQKSGRFQNIREYYEHTSQNKEVGKQSTPPFDTNKQFTESRQNGKQSTSTTTNENSKTQIFLPRNENVSTNKSISTTKNTGSNIYQFPSFLINGHTRYRNDTEFRIETIGTAIRETMKKMTKEQMEQVKVLYRPVSRKSFLEVAKINHYTDLCLLSSEELQEFVTDFPDAASVLIQELLHNMYIRDVKSVGILYAG